MSFSVYGYSNKTEEKSSRYSRPGMPFQCISSPANEKNGTIVDCHKLHYTRLQLLNRSTHFSLSFYFTFPGLGTFLYFAFQHFYTHWKHWIYSVNFTFWEVRNTINTIQFVQIAAVKIIQSYITICFWQFSTTTLLSNIWNANVLCKSFHIYSFTVFSHFFEVICDCKSTFHF